MKFNTLSHPLKTLFSVPLINQLARDIGFVSRIRGMRPLNLIGALCNVLGTKKQANLADIQRELCGLSLQAPAYKPFHNQFKKPQLTVFIRRLVALVTEQLLIAPFVASVPKDVPFQRIHVHDGSTLKLHEGLKGTFPSRFTKTMPAAAELHLTMDLLSGGIEYLGIDADKESERLYQPYANESGGTLQLLDAGYFDIGYVAQINQYGGHCIIRAKSNINPTIVEAVNADGNLIPSLAGKQLKSLKLQQGEIIDLKVSWKEHRGTFRLIAAWDKKKQRVGYLITTLSRQCLCARQIQQYYALRWQVELLFKELKSYCSLSTFATQNTDIVKTLIWSSVLVMLLKRYLAFGVSALYQTPISTHKTQRSATSWMNNLVRGLCGQIDMDTAVEHIATFLNKNARRAHSKRDEGSLAMQLKLFVAGFNNTELIKI